MKQEELGEDARTHAKVGMAGRSKSLIYNGEVVMARPRRYHAQGGVVGREGAVIPVPFSETGVGVGLGECPSLVQPKTVLVIMRPWQ